VDHVIVVEGVTRTVGETTLVRDVSFAVGRGEALALIGPSGSGKTTVLRLIAGLDVPTAGRILIDGQIASEAGWACAPHLRGIGMVFQKPSLWPHMTVVQNVAFGLGGQPRREVERRLEEVLHLTRLVGLESRRPHHLSGGEAQRAALARAISQASHSAAGRAAVGARSRAARQHDPTVPAGAAGDQRDGGIRDPRPPGGGGRHRPGAAFATGRRRVRRGMAA